MTATTEKYIVKNTTKNVCLQDIRYLFACPIAPPPITVPMNNAHRFSDHGGKNSEQLV